MALVRVYCGVVAAEMAPWLTCAVVDDSGRLLDMRHISDDPAGYAYLSALLADRSGGTAPVAIDSHEHLVAQLLAAASRPVAIADEMALVDFSERFSDDTSYDEVQAPTTQRRAVGLARALQAGALYATAQSPSWDLDEIKPVLAAHGAVTAGRQAAAAALRDVLRELYPAALRAYPDPADFIPLTILDALPEPGLLTPSPSSRNRDAALVADLSSSGVVDATTATNAITALRVAVEESPRWNANRLLAPVVAETVRQAVAAVRACDRAGNALMGSLTERLSAIAANAGARPYLVQPLTSAPVSPAVTRPGPAAEVPVDRFAPRANAASAAAAGVVIPGPRTEPSFGDQPYADPRFADPGHAASQADWPQQEFAPEYAGAPAAAYANGTSYGAGYTNPPHQSASPGSPAGPTSPASPGYGNTPYSDSAFTDPYGFAPTAPGQAYPGATPVQPYPGAAPAQNYPGSLQNYPGSPQDYPVATPAQAPVYSPDVSSAAYGPAAGAPPYTFDDSSVTTLTFEMDPLNAPLETRHPGPAAGRPSAGPANGVTSTTGWQTPVPPPQPSALRLVDSSFRDPLNDPLTEPLPGRGAPPQLRVIDGGLEAAPAGAPQDDDLLIFSETSSAWFTQVDEVELMAEPPSWGRLADDGWRAAEQVAHPAVGDATTAGLPRRVPQANLVPGSAHSSERALRIVRDAHSIAEHTDGYFRGWRRGQEIGGFAVGQRDRAAWEFNREQRLRDGTDQRARLS